MEGEQLAKIRIIGGLPLQGEVTIQGSKNGVLPIMAACIIIKGTCVIEHCPVIQDVLDMQKLLEGMGAVIVWKEESIYINCSEITTNELPREYMVHMRSSIILLGALLSRNGSAMLSYPGGCMIGERPINYHIKALEKMGVVIEANGETILADGSYMQESEIVLPFPSVGATENIILAAMSVNGYTKLHNYAKEPEIEMLCEFLQCAGAMIEGYGTEILQIKGRTVLKPVQYRVASDRIVAGTYLIGCQAAKGKITLYDAPVEHMKAIITLLEEMGSSIVCEGTTIQMETKNRGKNYKLLQTRAYPYFPTDLQSQIIVALSLAEGESIVEETIFENRFRMIAQLHKMGAKININGQKAFIEGVTSLKGSHVKAEELRGGAALVLAGICASGESIIENRQYIDRGYVDICKDLRKLGVQIQ